MDNISLSNLDIWEGFTVALLDETEDASPLQSCCMEHPLYLKRKCDLLKIQKGPVTSTALS